MQWAGEITMPWPDRNLHPNARVHFRALAAAKKQARSDAYWLAEKARIQVPSDGSIIVALGFHAPDNRRRDLDGMFASMKAALDGISDALGIDDNRFGFVIGREDPEPPHGKVTVKIGWKAQ